jgi:ribonuclease HI
VSGPARGPAILQLHIDGASRGNPGDAGFGVHITTADGEPVAELYGYLGQATNNVAEYQALLNGLRFALERGAREVRVFSDSELVVRQMNGVYKVKHPAMLPLHREARALLEHFSRTRIEHVRREQNQAADRLANLAVDEKCSRVVLAGSG